MSASSPKPTARTASGVRAGARNSAADAPTRHGRWHHYGSSSGTRSAPESQTSPENRGYAPPNDSRPKPNCGARRPVRWRGSPSDHSRPGIVELIAGALPLQACLTRMLGAGKRQDLTPCRCPCAGRRASAFITNVEKAKNTPATRPQPSAASSVRAKTSWSMAVNREVSRRETGMGYLAADWPTVLPAAPADQPCRALHAARVSLPPGSGSGCFRVRSRRWSRRGCSVPSVRRAGC